MKCRRCNKSISEEDLDIHTSYWKPNLQFPVHKACKKESMTFERIECQTIDKSCNDCIYFKADNTKHLGYRKGMCIKKNIKRIAYSNYCYDDTTDCFKHREE